MPRLPSGKILTRQSGWDGVSDDPRAVRLYRGNYFASQFIISKHFDIFSKPNILTPYRSFKADTNDGSTPTGMKQYFVKDFLYASASPILYGLGQNGTGQTKIVYKADATTGNWTLPPNSEGNVAVMNGCIVEYKDYLWGFQGTNKVWKWGALSGTPTITNSAGTVGTIYNTITAIAVNAGGTLYNVNDVLHLTGGSNTATAIVTSISSGAVTGVTLVEPGYNYAASSVATTVVPSGGTGCTITISTVGNTNTTISSIAQGVIAKDDNLYMAYNNIIIRVYPSGTVQDQALKLPTNIKITSLTNYGNYLAIGCSQKSIYNGVSKVYLWNLTSPDIQEVLDWGEGELRILENVEGTLIGITDRYLNNSAGAGRGSMIIQSYSGGSVQVLREVFTSKLNGITMPQAKTVKNNRLFFIAKIITNATGTEYNEGIWSYGRKSSAYPYMLTLDYIDENVTSSGIQGFGAAANYFYLAHSADGSIDKIDDTVTYSFSSILETQIFDWGDITNDKRLDSLKISFTPLTSGQTVTLKYKVDFAASWTTIGTFNIVGSLYHTFVREETGNKDFATGREYKFQILSTGGAEITGFEAFAEPLINP